MKTVVLFRLGNSGYISIPADRLATFPQLGYSYLINGVQWDVADRPVEPLASTDSTAQLMELLGLDNKDQESRIKAHASITHLEQPVDKGKIIIASATSDEKFVLVRLVRSDSKSTAKSGIDLTVRPRKAKGPEQLVSRGEGKTGRRRRKSS
jgi:hypothetical protein